MRSVAMLMLDLFSGLGGASQAMRDRGWTVVTIDNDPRFKPRVVADARRIVLRARPDLLWASPPCAEFSRLDQPWYPKHDHPDLSCVLAVHHWVRELDPRYWILENVRGLQRWIGPARQHFGPIYLWGNFPLVLAHVRPWKQRISGRCKDLRAKIPYELSLNIALVLERAGAASSTSLG
jgi:site-specific DNA-cytosine methylase